MDKKEQIMSNALKLFASEGYEGCGVMKIVSASDVTKPTLYHYFGSKEGVLRAIYEHYFAGFLDQLKKRADFEDNLMECIGNIIGCYSDFASSNPDFYWLSAHLRRGPKESDSYRIVKKFHEDERQILNHLMKEISRIHVNLQGMENQLTRNLQNLIGGLIEERITSQEMLKIDEKDKILLTKQFLYGIFSL